MASNTDDGVALSSSNVEAIRREIFEKHVSLGENVDLGVLEREFDRVMAEKFQCSLIILSQMMEKHDIRVDVPNECIVCQPGAKLTSARQHCAKHGLLRALYYALGTGQWLLFCDGVSDAKCCSCNVPRPQYQQYSDCKYYCFNCAADLLENHERARSLGVKSARKQ